MLIYYVIRKYNYYKYLNNESNLNYAFIRLTNPRFQQFFKYKILYYLFQFYSSCNCNVCSVTFVPKSCCTLTCITRSLLDMKMKLEETYICFQVRDRYLYTTMLDYFLSQKISGCFSWHWNIYFDTKLTLPRSTWTYMNIRIV